MTGQMTKGVTNKQFVIEVAKIMQNGVLFDGDISKEVLLEKLKRKYSKPKKCKECDSRPGYHTLECSVGGFGGYHPCM